MLKKCGIFILAGLTAVGMCGCGTKDRDSSSETENSLSVEHQLDQIVSDRELWQNPFGRDYEGKTDGGVFYAVTDLDQNGRLELVVTDATSDGDDIEFTGTCFFEMNESGTKLERKDWDKKKNSKKLNICDSDNFVDIDTVYIDNKNKEYYYAVEDADPSTLYSLYLWKYGSQDGKMDVLADDQWNDSPKEDGDTWVYYDKEGKTHSITEEEFTFDKLVKRKYPSFEKRKVKIEWISYFDYFKIKKITDVQLRHALLQSYAEFKIDKKISGTQADSLTDYVRAYDEIDWQEMEYRMIKEDYAQYKMYLPLLEKKEKVWNNRGQEKYLSDYFSKKKIWPMVEVADLTGDGVSELVLVSEQGDLILSRQGDKYYIYDGFMEQGASTRIYEPEGIIEEPSDEREEAKYNKLIWKDGKFSLKQVAKSSRTNYTYHFEIDGKKVTKSQFKKWSEKYAQKEITVYILSTKTEKNK